MHASSAVHRLPGFAGALLLTMFTAMPARAETPVQRGDYLVNTIAACGNCHSPKDDKGKVIPGRALSGGLEFDEAFGHISNPNITPDPETGIGAWTQAQIVIAIREGRRPDGSPIGPPMPTLSYRDLSDGDAAAIAAYLKSIPPVRHAVARSRYSIPVTPEPGPRDGHVAEPVRGATAAYGQYLMVVAHCMQCHTIPGGGQPFDLSKAFAGGRLVPVERPPGTYVVSRNLTSDPTDGLGRWTDAQIKAAITKGIRPDGTHMIRTMPFDWYEKIHPGDLDAMVKALRALPPMKTPETPKQ